MAPIVEAVGLRRVYGDTVAVAGATFSVEEGRSLAIVGESGSGKSTIAKMLSGLVAPTSGTLTVCGSDRTTPAKGTRARRARGGELQIVLQDPYSSLDPRQRAGDSVTEIIRLHQRVGRQDAVRRAAELFDLVGLGPDRMRAYPRALSGGQRQRVAIARAFAAEPKVVVMDEAVAALDVSVQAQVLNLIADIREQTGVTIIFISHDLAVVRQVSDDIIVMSNGEIVESGTTSAVLDMPSHPYTQLLRASVPTADWTPPPVRARTTATVS